MRNHPEFDRIANGKGDAASALSFLDDLHAETIVELRRRYGGSDGIPAKAMYQGWGKRAPIGVVIHVPGYGAGHRTLDGWDLARRFTRKGAPVSAHLVINWPDGSILCPVSVRNRAWHARGMNNTYFGIDVVSPGPPTPAGSNRWLDGEGNGHVLRPDRSPLHPVDVADFGPERSTLPYGYRYWHMPTKEQIVGLIVALRALRLAYPTMQAEKIIRHSDFTTKVDPGPFVPLETVRSLVFGKAAAWEVGVHPQNTQLALTLPLAAGWERYLLSQWQSPTGIITDTDRKLPGRNLPAEEVGNE